MATQTCPNCGAAVETLFCPSCGQTQASLNVSVGAWLREVLDELFAVNGKLPRTLRALLFRPGKLTREWLAGKRASYITPLRVYLTSAVLFFGLFALTSGSRDVARGVAAGFQSSAPATEAPDNRFERWLERIQTDEAYAAELAAGVLDNFPRAMLVALPVIAALLMRLHRSAGFYFIGHLVFVLHIQAFSFFVGTLLIPVLNASGALEPAATVVFAGAGILIYGYMLLALRTVYRTSWPRTAVNFLVIVAADTMLRTALALGLAATVA